jgi:hypothetical protein
MKNGRRQGIPQGICSIIGLIWQYRSSREKVGLADMRRFFALRQNVKRFDLALRSDPAM